MSENDVAVEAPVVEAPAPVEPAVPEVPVEKAPEDSAIEYSLAAQIVAGILSGPNASPKDVDANVAIGVQYAQAIMDAVDKANG